MHKAAAKQDSRQPHVTAETGFIFKLGWGVKSVIAIALRHNLWQNHDRIAFFSVIIQTPNLANLPAYNGTVSVQKNCMKASRDLLGYVQAVTYFNWPYQTAIIILETPKTERLKSWKF